VFFLHYMALHAHQSMYICSQTCRILTPMKLTPKQHSVILPNIGRFAFATTPFIPLLLEEGNGFIKSLRKIPTGVVVANINVGTDENPFLQCADFHPHLHRTLSIYLPYDHVNLLTMLMVCASLIANMKTIFSHFKLFLLHAGHSNIIETI
jgi:hypothetical protein